MRYRRLFCLFLLSFVMAVAGSAQSEPKNPVTLAELRRSLSTAEASETLIETTNRELIAAVKQRGVDFVMTPEEEWALKLREASDELIAAVRGAIDPAEREFRLTVRRQQDLYTAFATNYNRPDLAGRQTALTAARDFVASFAKDPNVAEIITFMQRSLPRLEQSVAMLQQREAAMERAQAQAAERDRNREQLRAERDRRRQEAAAARNAPQTGMPITDRTGAAPLNPSDRNIQTPRPNRPTFPIVRRP